MGAHMAQYVGSGRIQVSVDDVVTGLLYVAVVVALLVWLVPR
jgi:hypothetical protein